MTSSGQPGSRSSLLLWCAVAVCITVVFGYLGPQADSPGGIARSAAGNSFTAGGNVAPIESVAMLPDVAGSGQLSPQSGPASLVTGNGVARSLQPWLTDGALSGQVSVEVYDLSIGQAPGRSGPWKSFDDSATAGRVQLGANLTPNHSYGWRWAPRGSSTWTPADPGYYRMSVDMGGDKGALTNSFGGVAMNLVTGYASVNWSSPWFDSASGPSGVGLAWANDEDQPAPGLPAGWSLAPSTGSSWRGLSESADKVAGMTPRLANGSLSVASSAQLPASVVIQGWSGGGVTFLRNQWGVYESRMSSGSATLPNVSASLVSNGGPGAWLLSEQNGRVTQFEGGRATKTTVGQLPSGATAWDGQGRVTSVTDPIGRTIGFTYKGSGSCASDSWTKSGYGKAPDGLLCAVNYPDGTSSQIGYTPGGRVGLIKDPGNHGVAWQWDTVGRVVGVRGDSVLRAAVVDDQFAADTFVSKVAYEPRTSRVASITSGAPWAGRAGIIERFSYPTIDINDVTKDSLETLTITGGAVRGDKVANFKSRAGESVLQKTTIKASSWTPVESLGRDGLSTSAEWTNGGPSKIVGTNKAETAMTYDQFDRPLSQTGPFLGGSGGVRSETVRDADKDDKAWNGLQATMYANPNLSGSSTPGWWKPNSSALDYSWESSPVGSGPWSGRAQGVWKPDASLMNKKGATKWTFEPKAGGGSVAFYVDGQLCDTGTGTTCSLDINPSVVHQVMMELSITDQKGAGYVSVQAAPAGRAPGATPPAAVTPNFGLTTKNTNNDSHSGSARWTGAKSAFSQPWTGHADSQSTSGGLTTSYKYEGIDAGKSQWGRQLSALSPAGRSQGTTYWGNDEKATGAPSQCDVDPVSQSGLPREIQRVDGTRLRTWYDIAGRPVAAQTVGVGNATITTCSSYAEGGALVSSSIYGADGKRTARVDTDLVDAGKPWQVAQRTIRGDGGETVRRYATDLSGNTTDYTDDRGTHASTTYTDTAKVAVRVIEVPKAAPMKFEYRYESDTDWLSTVTVNGTQQAGVGYNRVGQVKAIDYPAGIKKAFTWSAAELPDSMDTYVGPSTIHEGLTRTDAGRILAHVVNGSGSQTFSEARNYSYNTENRLVKAAILTQGGIGDPRPAQPQRTAAAPAPASSSAVAPQPSPPAPSPARVQGPRRGDVVTDYGYGAVESACPGGNPDAGKDALRTSGTRAGVPYFSCYNDRSQLTSTTDPLVTGGQGSANLSYDDFGRVTAIKTGAKGNPVSFTWATNGQPTSITDGSGDSAVTTKLSYISGRLDTKSVTIGAVTTTSQYQYASLGGETPIAITDTAGVPTTTQYDLPGDVHVAVTATGSTLTSNDLAGNALFTAALGKTAKDKLAIKGVTLADRLGPYGEVLAPAPNAPAPNAGIPDYKFAATAKRETLSGPSGMVTMGVRAYHPALGTFMSPDPVTGAGINPYSYTNADPINSSDYSGADAYSNIAHSVLLTASAIAGFFGSTGQVVAAGFVAVDATLNVVEGCLSAEGFDATRISFLAADALAAAATAGQAIASSANPANVVPETVYGRATVLSGKSALKSLNSGDYPYYGDQMGVSQSPVQIPKRTVHIVDSPTKTMTFEREHWQEFAMFGKRVEFEELTSLSGGAQIKQLGKGSQFSDAEEEEINNINTFLRGGDLSETLEVNGSLRERPDIGRLLGLKN